MNQQKIIKFNLYMSCAMLLILLFMFIGSTVAYFTSQKKNTSTITAGNVKITLSEAAVKRDEIGNLVMDPDKPRIFSTAEETVINDYGKIYPGQTIFKDPTITNTGDREEWVAAKITLIDGEGDLTKIIGYEGYEEIDIERLLSGGLLDEHVDFGTWKGIEDVCYNHRYAMIQVADADAGEFVFYFLMLQPLQVGESVVLFDHINFEKMWDNTFMQHINNLKINIQAFGVQTFQLESCLQAMTTAFPEYFVFD